MERLSRIQIRLESLGELSQLVRALRSMAATRAREAQEASEVTRQYRAIVERGIGSISSLACSVPAVPANSAANTKFLLVVASEQGFVGGFNAQIIDRALETRMAGERVVVVGRRGQIAATERKLDIDTALPMTSRKDGVTPLARRVAKRLAGAAAARLVFARLSKAASTDIQVRQVLPRDTPATCDAPSATPPLHNLTLAELMAGLAAEYLFAQIADALMESLASENAARLRTMDAASRNIDERLGALVRDERAARQEQTTTDMLEVVAGAEAANRR